MNETSTDMRTMTSNITYKPRDPRKAAQVSILLLWIYVGSELFYGFSSMSELVALQQLSGDTPFSMFDEVPGLTGGENMRNALSGIANFLAFMVTSFFFLKWVYLTNANAKYLVATKPMRPGWAVGWYFIPFATLWKPFRGMRETWQISANPDNWRSVSVPAKLRWWWGLWIATCIFGNGALRASIKAENVSQYRGSESLTVMSSLLGIAAALVLIRIIRQLTERQTAALGPGMAGSERSSRKSEPSFKTDTFID
ncbi:hypothetical protein HDG34_005652 [Paraburkholderia sp. HC6.4b]|uniref:DUF4328 domain-containing protein n=1 Tax=unclassified Paraburkholderia TaxID=2615204 RepID=UPI00161ED77B|nr:MULTISPECIES: DUF4328 domain-containing protein [unclassified Paraburkholderia]MBB5411691.1 hypothetical protein [Paraburkholderia sp. HC6.4b]MBB5453280.1 hypothetical protein [Paraburkholderia sp. Kb1A]